MNAVCILPETLLTQLDMQGVVVGVALCTFPVRVLVGKYCTGNPSMIVPPPKNPSRPEILYEPVVNNPGNPSIFVVFFDTQCYPEYLITF